MISKTGLQNFILVFCQFACLFLLIFTGPLYSGNIVLLIVQFSGIILGIWAFFALSLKNLNIGPEIRQNGSLVVRGPYTIIRHPMYSSILLYAVPLLIYCFSWLRMLVLAFLVINMLYKLHYEEKLLCRKFEGYKDYKSRTYRIIPFLF